MSSEQKPNAKEILAEGWHLTQQGMALNGMQIPDCIQFQIDDRRQIRATRVATLDELAKGIGAIDEDIERLSKGVPRIVVNIDYKDIEQLEQAKAALLELQKRASRSGRPGSTTVIEALFPDVPVKKKTDGERSEIEQWLSIRKEAALKIDPETAEVDWSYGQGLDPYGVLDEWELPEELHSVGRERFARSPGSDVWVSFHDLPDATREALWKRHSCKLAFPTGLEDLPMFPDDSPTGARSQGA